MGEGRRSWRSSDCQGKAGEQAALDQLYEKERGNIPRSAKWGEDSRDWQGSMGTQAIGFQAGFGFMSLQQTGQLISPVIMIPHSYHRHDSWFTGRLLGNRDGLAGATHGQRAVKGVLWHTSVWLAITSPSSCKCIGN